MERGSIRKVGEIPFAKRLAFGTILLLGSLCIGFIVLEAVARVGLQIYECDDYLGWTFKKGSFGFKVSRDLEIFQPQNFNDFGLRDIHKHGAKSKEHIRVLVLGDSFTAGLQVADNELFTARLEQSLNDIGNKENVFEVINAGVDGYGTTQQILLFQGLAGRLKPDAVILQIFLDNDVADNWPGVGSWIHWIAIRCGRPYFIPGEEVRRLKNNGEPVRRPMTLVSRILSNSTLFSILVPKPPAPDGASPDFNFFHMWKAENANKVDPAWRHFLWVLSEFKRVVEARGIPLSLLLIPRKEDTWEGETNEIKVQRYIDLREFLRANEMKYIDVLSALLKQGTDGGPYYFNSDEHLNSQGHLFVANTLSEWISRQCSRLEVGIEECFLERSLKGDRLPE